MVTRRLRHFRILFFGDLAKGLNIIIALSTSIWVTAVIAFPANTPPLRFLPSGKFSINQQNTDLKLELRSKWFEKFRVIRRNMSTSAMEAEYLRSDPGLLEPFEQFALDRPRVNKKAMEKIFAKVCEKGVFNQSIDCQTLLHASYLIHMLLETEVAEAGITFKEFADDTAKNIKNWIDQLFQNPPAAQILSDIVYSIEELRRHFPAPPPPQSSSTPSPIYSAFVKFWGTEQEMYAEVSNPTGKNGTFHTAKELVPYLKDLDVEVLYLLPFFPGPGDNGFDPIHLYPGLRYGGIKAFEAFMLDLRDEGITPIFDGVFDHVSPNSLEFKKYRQGQKLYQNMFLDFSKYEPLESFFDAQGDMFVIYRDKLSGRTFKMKQMMSHLSDTDHLLRWKKGNGDQHSTYCSFFLRSI